MDTTDKPAPKRGNNGERLGGSRTLPVRDKRPAGKAAALPAPAVGEAEAPPAPAGKGKSPAKAGA